VLTAAGVNGFGERRSDQTESATESADAAAFLQLKLPDIGGR
jgi:hypothetical protein